VGVKVCRTTDETAEVVAAVVGGRRGGS
jgi:hypothetical protein